MDRSRTGDRRPDGSRRLAMVCLAAAMSFAPLGFAQAGMISFDSDAAFLASSFTKVGGGNARWGNGGPSGDWEYSIVDSGDIPTGAGNPRQLDWLSGTNPHEVTFSYSGAGVASLDIDISPNGTASGAIGGGANTLLIRAKDRDEDGNLAVLQNILLTFDIDGSTLGLGDLLGDTDAQYVGVIDPRLAGGFSVSADGFINGMFDPRGSLPAYQFKVGVTQIPEPGSLALLGVGLAGLGLLYRRRRRS